MFGRPASGATSPRTPTPSGRSDSSWQQIPALPQQAPTASQVAIPHPDTSEDEDAAVSATPKQLQSELRDLQRSNKRLAREAKQAKEEVSQVTAAAASSSTLDKSLIEAMETPQHRPGSQV